MQNKSHQLLNATLSLFRKEIITVKMKTKTNMQMTLICLDRILTPKDALQSETCVFEKISLK